LIVSFIRIILIVFLNNIDIIPMVSYVVGMKRGEGMVHMSVKQAALWGLFDRRVRLLCEQSKVVEVV
jgi:hypothetical protein